jgi:hypothetical protein
MSLKQRNPKTKIDALPSAAWVFHLLTGEPAQCRIAGWVAHAQQGLHGQPTLDEVIAAHADALVEEARSAGFEPAFLTKRCPTGAAFEAWKATFLATHRY